MKCRVIVNYNDHGYYYHKGIDKDFKSYKAAREACEKIVENNFNFKTRFKVGTIDYESQEFDVIMIGKTKLNTPWNSTNRYVYLDSVEITLSDDCSLFKSKFVKK